MFDHASIAAETVKDNLQKHIVVFDDTMRDKTMQELSISLRLPDPLRSKGRCVLTVPGRKIEFNAHGEELKMSERVRLQSDNASPVSSAGYDGQIQNSMPYYSEFAGQIIDVLKCTGRERFDWMDLGCGTGSLVEKAVKAFPGSRFVMADPAENMLALAKARFEGRDFEFINAASQDVPVMKERFDVISAVQCHHYLSEAERVQVSRNIYESLRPEGFYFCFENIIYEDKEITDFEMRRWAQYRIRHGYARADLEEFLGRLGKNYFPITVREH